MIRISHGSKLILALCLWLAADEKGVYIGTSLFGATCLNLVTCTAPLMKHQNQAEFRKQLLKLAPPSQTCVLLNFVIYNGALGIFMLVI